MTKRKVKAPPAAKPRSNKVAKPRVRKAVAPKAPLRKPDDAGIDWDRIRADYEIGARKLKAIGLEHGITPQKIAARARADNWPKRGEVAEAPPPKTGGDLPEDAEALATRLTKLIAREIADVEGQRRMTRDDAEGERQARRLASLVRSIDKLHEIEQAARQAKKNDPDSDRKKRREEDERIYAELQRRFALCFAAADQDRLREEADAARGADA